MNAGLACTRMSEGKRKKTIAPGKIAQNVQGEKQLQKEESNGKRRKGEVVTILFYTVLPPQLHTRKKDVD